MVRSIYYRKAKENGYLHYQSSSEHRRRTRGGVATVIACSKKSDLDRFEIEQTDPNTGSKFHYGFWFRLWSDGWLEQGVRVKDYWGYTAYEYGRLYLPLPYANTNYDVQVTGDYTNATADASAVGGYQPVVRYKTYYNLVPTLGGDAGQDTSVDLAISCKGFAKQETIPNILSGKVWTATAQSLTILEPVWINDPNA